MYDRKWQYKVHTVKTGAFSSLEKNDAMIQDTLTRLGMEGWELVAVTTEGTYKRLFLKRA